MLTQLVERVLTAAYVSRDIAFDPPFIFRKEEGVKVINGIVKTGRIPKGAKPNQNISAAQNFGYGLKIMKRGALRRSWMFPTTRVKDMWAFIDEKLTEDGLSMKVDTLYKNFMGVGGPKDYGLTRRMVQIYLLCLVREGRVRVSLGPKAGLDTEVLDYSNIAGVEFSARVLDALLEVQKLGRPENWDVLRPYAEKLLGIEIPLAHDDAAIRDYRERLRRLFNIERDASARVAARAKNLFGTMKLTNPYEVELEQIARLFAHPVDSGDDIHLILYALKDALGYKAFDTNSAVQSEVDDLANRLRDYSNMKAFLDYETELITAHRYCSTPLGDQKEFTDVRKSIETVKARLASIRDYIDSDVRLKTELIGCFPPTQGETGTIAAMIREYASLYVPLHETVVNRIDASRRQILDVMRGPDIEVLSVLDGITALQPPSTARLRATMEELLDRLFECPSPSRASVEDQLRRGPLHECGLSFLDATSLVRAAEEAAKRASELVDEVFRRKMEVFLNPAIRERLEQGRFEPVIDGLLRCATIDDLRDYFKKTVPSTPGIVDTINKYLKRIIVKRVKLTEFRPRISTIQESQIDDVVKEFIEFLRTQFSDHRGDDDSFHDSAEWEE